MPYTTINKSSDYFNTKLYTGTGATNAQTSVGFQPDWVWIQNRGGTYASVIYDAVRGATKQIEPQGTGAEATVSDTLTSFDSDGFTLGADSSSYCNRSSSPNTYVAWNWKANGSGSSNSDGSITSTVSANTTSGFSICTYTGTGANATIGHGLGVAPKVVFIKNTYQAENWVVGHDSIGFTKFLQLNTTAVEATATNRFNDTAPTSSVFSVGTETQVNQAGGTHVAYCFAEKKGFSKFGLYNGNGNADGSFIYTGFKPAFVLIKAKGSLQNWSILDNKRNTFNVMDKYIDTNSTNAEGTADIWDFTSNGFKQRNSYASHNASGQGYIYMAFAEVPLVGTNNIPATAR